MGAVQGVARGLSGRLAMPGRRGDTGDGSTCGQAVCSAREVPRTVMGGMGVSTALHKKSDQKSDARVNKDFLVSF